MAQLELPTHISCEQGTHHLWAASPRKPFGMQIAAIRNQEGISPGSAGGWIQQLRREAFSEQQDKKKKKKKGFALKAFRNRMADSCEFSLTSLMKQPSSGHL